MYSFNKTCKNLNIKFQCCQIKISMVFSIQSLMFFIKYYRISNYHNTENQENFLLIYFLGISLT